MFSSYVVCFSAPEVCLSHAWCEIKYILQGCLHTHTPSTSLMPTAVVYLSPWCLCVIQHGRKMTWCTSTEMTQIFLVFFRMAQSLLNDFKVPFFTINSFLPTSFLKRLLNQVGFLGDHTVAKNIQIQFGTQISFTVKVPNSYTFRSTFLVLFIYFLKHFVTVCKEKGMHFLHSVISMCIFFIDDLL